jgi:predicted MFS family arabinose efflux permease
MAASVYGMWQRASEAVLISWPPLSWSARNVSSQPKQKHGIMSGLIIVFSALGGTTGSIITGNIFGKLGGQTAFYFSLIPIGVLLVGLFFFKKLQAKSVA